MELNFEKLGGLIPVIIQDFESGKVLMLGFMNEEALKKTLETGKVCFYSRTRNKLWIKGETSGHFLEVREILVDCDRDTLLIKVKPYGPVCHEGYESCFYRKLNSYGDLEIIEKRKFQPEEVYGEGS
ncbi:MAG: phosphoribosyl-AMP cyclohydrolase [Caldimicrobium sp.]|jgi:phosphoribosyl-AMP cyclohydrolase